MICKQAKYNKKNFKLKLFLRLLAITVVIGTSTVAFTASSGNSNSRQKSAELSFFDPFELETIYVVTADNGINTTTSDNSGAAPLVTNSLETNVDDTVVTRPPVRVPYRPPFRSPFRPPWVPGPPSWYPGNPPWTP